MAVYTFVNGVRKRIFSHKPVVYVNGVKHTIGKCYTFVNGEKKKIFDTWSLKHEELFTSNATVELPFGTYQAIIRGAGGAGGKSVGSKEGFVGGVGGCGGKGSLVSETIVLSDTATADVMIGAGGKTYDNGGNGGKGGAAGRGEGLASGAGGGGGMPSVLLFTPSSTTIQYYGWESTTTFTTPYYAWKYTTRFTATVNSRQYKFERYPSKDEIVSNNKRYYWRGEPILGSEIEYGYTNTLNVLDGSLIYIDGGSVSGQRVRSVVQGTAVYTKTTSLSAGMAVYNSSFQQIGTASAHQGDYELTYNNNSYSRDNNSDITQSQTVTKVMLTQSYPASEDDYVYNTDLDVIGTVTSATSTTVVYNGDTYTRYSDIDTTQDVQESAQVYYANGGGGGGGGGAGGTANRRYDTGGPGGAGGGLYKVEIVNDAVEIISLAGKDGTNGAAYSTRGANGTAGLGDPDIYSGAGGTGNFGGTAGGSQAFGGGASGAGGGGGPGNFNTSAGGAGGGGAGGCKDAGGGGNAYNPNYSQFNSNVVSYNAGKTTPTDTLAENMTYGVNSNYGVGGTTNTDGAQGFILIKRVA